MPIIESETHILVEIAYNKLCLMNGFGWLVCFLVLFECLLAGVNAHLGIERSDVSVAHVI